jgi:DHA1 family tetracycline resistance protein-like MFS transporter
MMEVLNRPKVGPLLHVRLFYGLAFATFQSIFSLYAQAIGLSPQTTGFVLAYVGLLAVITQAVLIGPLTRRFRETWLIISGLWVMGISLLAWAFTSQLWLLLVVILPLALSGGVLNTVIQSSISKSVSRDEIGGILGISASLEALTRVVAPTVGGFLLGSIGQWAPGVFTALLMAWAVSFAYRRIIIPAHRKGIEVEAEGSHA